MEKNDIEFLIELQRKLNTQSHDGNADPVFWGVMERIKIPAYEGCGDGVELVIDSEDVYEGGELDKLIEWMRDTEYFDESKLKTIKDLDDAKELLEEEGFECSGIYDYQYIDILSTDTGAFLTKEACQHHIEINGHNLHNPRTYAMTAFRNFEFEQLLRILKTTDFKALLGTDDNH